VIETDEIDRSVRIVVLSDVQTERVTDYERQVVERARALRPDLVLFPGDYVQRSGRGYVAAARELGRLLDTLHAPLGAFAVEGNVEHTTWVDDVFGGTSVRALARTTTVPLGPISLTALSFEDSFDANLVLRAAPGFHVVFGHAPDFSLGDVDADLLVAGHTHGGQVQLPFFGPPVTYSQVPRHIAAGGLFAHAHGGRLVVSRGIGMERRNAPPLRFRCRPELVVVDLVPKRTVASRVPLTR
jgi:hypothetical protein